MTDTDKQDSTAETGPLRTTPLSEKEIASYEQELTKRAERLFKETNNYVYVWSAIYYSTKSNNRIPEWCVPYLKEISESIHEAANNINLFVAKNESIQTFDNKINRFTFKKVSVNGRQNAIKFMKDLPKTLKLVSKGKNSLIEYSRHNKTITIASMSMVFKDGVKEGERKSTDVNASLMNLLKIDDERYLRRIVAHGKKLIPLSMIKSSSYEEPEG